MAPALYTTTLSNGVKMPLVGLGTLHMESHVAYETVKVAVRLGCRLIDTASVYGNEEGIGKAIKELIEEGVVTREELFITAKASPTEMGEGKPEEALRKSLEKMQLEYVDLFLANFPTALEADGAHSQTLVLVLWRGIEEVYTLGLAKSIGVSNWNSEQIKSCLPKKKIPIHVSQIECHLHFRQDEHIDFCQEFNIAVMAFAPLGRPSDIDHVLPVGQLLGWAPAPSGLKEPVVLALAEKYGVMPAQVLLRYALGRGLAVIPRSTDPTHIEGNLMSYGVYLSAEDIDELDAVSQSDRFFVYDFMAGHYEDPFATERRELGDD